MATIASSGWRRPRARCRSKRQCWPCHPGWPPTCCPDVTSPNEFQAILNIHFRVDADRGPPGFIGLVGGTAEWVFVKRGHVSVTISAANRMVDQDAEAIAPAVWPDVRTALGLEGRMPPWRVVKERRATFAATAAQERLRPGPRTDLAEPGAGRRLDRYRVARHDRRCHQVRPNRGRGAARRLRTAQCRARPR